MSLRTRLILSYALVIFVCLGIAALAVTAFLQTYRDRVTQIHLDDIAQPIAVQIKALFRSQATLTDIWNTMQEQAQTNHVYILFSDDVGNLVRQITPEPNSLPLKINETLPHSITGAQHGILTVAPRRRFIYAAYPLVKPVNPQYSPVGTIILCQPRGSVAFVFAGLVSPFLWSGIIALGISLLLAFFIARSVYHPIQQISGAAAKVAQGDYHQVVPITGPAEIKKLAQNFNTMTQKVTESQQHLRNVVADVSHQLKTPLTSIRGFAQAMMDGTAADPGEKDKATRIIAEESQKMMRQVNQILELSRMQSGQVKMERKPVNLPALLNQCQDIFALRAEEKKITVSRKLEADPATVLGDADRLEDVFCNLIDNAIKNTPAYGVIEIAISREKDNFIKTVIADSGLGIPPEQLPHVFDRFHQSTELRSGFGLGLAIAREIVQAHGGRIEVASNPGEGARFNIFLPAL